MSFDEEHLDEHYLCQQAYAAMQAERDALARDLAIYKGREEGKQLVVNQLEARVAALEAWAGRAISALHEAYNDTPGWCDTYKAVVRDYPQSETPAEQSNRNEANTAPSDAGAARPTPGGLLPNSLGTDDGMWTEEEVQDAIDRGYARRLTAADREAIIDGLSSTPEPQGDAK